MTEFQNWLDHPVATINSTSQQAAIEHQQQLTKPAGSLGQLETIAIQLAGLQATAKPSVDNVQITVFAGDHGVVDEGISAFPQAVTAEMVHNFSRGGAAISVLARETATSLSVVNTGTVTELEKLEQVKDKRIAAGTANFMNKPAMTLAQCQQALLIGRDVIEEAKNANMQLFIGGEMGIGNTSSATAIASALLNLAPEKLAGPGTGLNAEGVQHKAHVIKRSLELHQSQLNSPLSVLQHVGGFEIAALVGAYLHCAKLGLPVLIDGFITSVAALVAQKISPESSQWFLFSHQSAEPGHQLILAELKAQPLLNINMRLGEASGAAVVLPLIKLSCALHNSMATFAEAAVSQES
ncbi:nicotinate-nucleotide--dimethylbenzimidazole phosphoribosyltransferase [Pseudomonadota bacterium]|nr:nicotinate-nucleotide--dimethylbenzimidazole phosphoribosyltransferase [Pseudomonadota bacterium]